MKLVIFRGLTISNEWVYGFLSILSKKHYEIDAGSYISNCYGSPFAYKIRPETMGEYTGLKDRNDKEIYEGDIVGCFKCNDSAFEHTIVFQTGAFGYTSAAGFFVSFDENYNFRWKNNKSMKIEVVGNIYQIEEE